METCHCNFSSCSLNSTVQLCHSTTTFFESTSQPHFYNQRANFYIAMGNESSSSTTNVDARYINRMHQYAIDFSHFLNRSNFCSSSDGCFPFVSCSSSQFDGAVTKEIHTESVKKSVDSAEPASASAASSLPAKKKRKKNSDSAKSKTSSGITFIVDDTVEMGGKYCGDPRRHFEPTKGQSLEEAWRTVSGTGSKIEAMSPAPKGTVAVFTKQNLFVKAVHAAFFGHHPLILSPDMIWTTIAQGLAHHVDQNAEKLRHLFVKHKGKKELEIQRPGFVKGSPHNDWPGVFPEFSAKIKANSLPGTTELLENDFSTTGPVEKIVSHICLMDAVQHYFSYSMCCGCGFPRITLTGTPADWEKIRSKAEQLKKYGLDWWLKALLPALDQFVAAAHGRPDLDFWMSLCYINTGTSRPIYEPLNGWVQVFFPYLIAPGQGFRHADPYSGEHHVLPRIQCPHLLRPP